MQKNDWTASRDNSIDTAHVYGLTQGVSPALGLIIRKLMQVQHARQAEETRHLQLAIGYQPVLQDQSLQGRRLCFPESKLPLQQPVQPDRPSAEAHEALSVYQVYLRLA